MGCRLGPAHPRSDLLHPPCATAAPDIGRDIPADSPEASKPLHGPNQASHHSVQPLMSSDHALSGSSHLPRPVGPLARHMHTDPDPLKQRFVEPCCDSSAAYPRTMYACSGQAQHRRPPTLNHVPPCTPPCSGLMRRWCLGTVRPVRPILVPCWPLAPACCACWHCPWASPLNSSCPSLTSP